MIVYFSQEIINFVKDNTVRLLSLFIFKIEFVKGDNKNNFIRFNLITFSESDNFFIEALHFVSKIKFYGGLYFFNDEEREKYRDTWKKGTDWLNEKGEISATLQEVPYGNTSMAMCITVERKVRK